MSKILSVCVAGDCTGFNIFNRNPLKDFGKKISESDIFLFNLEGVVVSEPCISSIFDCFPRNPLLRPIVKSIFSRQPCIYSSPSFARLMNLCRFNVATLANNHALDWGRKGIIETKKHLLRNNILPIGAGLNVSDACKPSIINVNNFRIGFLNYCDIGRVKLLDLEIFSAGLNIFRITAGYGFEGVASCKKCNVEKQILEFKERTDFIVVSLHVGKVYQTFSDKVHLDIVERILDAGANVVVCHHPHVPQGIIVKDKGLAFLSMGDFIVNWPNPFYRMGYDRPTTTSIISFIDIFRDKLNVRILPVKLCGGLPTSPNPREAFEILEKVRNLSSPADCLKITEGTAFLTI